MSFATLNSALCRAASSPSLWSVPLPLQGAAPPASPKAPAARFSKNLCLKPWLHVQKKRNRVHFPGCCCKRHHLLEYITFLQSQPFLTWDSRALSSKHLGGGMGGCSARRSSFRGSTAPAQCTEGETSLPSRGGQLRELMKPKTGSKRQTLPKWAQRREQEQLRGRNEVIHFHSPWALA